MALPLCLHWEERQGANTANLTKEKRGLVSDQCCSSPHWSGVTQIVSQFKPLNGQFEF